jgi:hypothetical protein
MQHQSSGGQWLGEVQVTVPAVIMDWLRNAAYAEIGLAAEALDTVAFAVDREGHPEWFRGPAENLREIYALLDAIGWSKTVPPVAVQLDLSRDCWALMRALQGAAEFADEDSSEAVHGDVEQTERGLALVRNVEAERVEVLWDFIAEARACIDELAVQEGEGGGFVLDLAA